jgi:DNA (cytosine-5)-methyltransferase 1
MTPVNLFDDGTMARLRAETDRFVAGVRRRARRREKGPGMVIDLYAGGGGASSGIAGALRRPVDVAVNHNPCAIDMHARNHPETIHLRADVDAVNIHAIVGGVPVLALWASPECIFHSRARGGRPRANQSREQGMGVLRWVRAARPVVLMCENVIEWEDWGPCHPEDHPDPKLRGQAIKERAGETWREWVQALRDLGYAVEWRRLVAADYGTPGERIGSGKVNATTRERLFVIARRDGLPIVWPEPTHGPRNSPEVKAGKRAPWLPVADCIDWSLPMCSIFATRAEAKAWAREHKADGVPQRPLSDATMARIAEGMKRFVLGKRRPFLVNLTHGGRVESTDEPIKTITAANGGEKAAVAPMVAKARSNGWDRPGSGVRAGDEPLPTNTTTEQFAAVAASLLNLSHGGRHEDIADPANTITAGPKGGDRLLLAAHLSSMRGRSVGSGVDVPAPTVTGHAHEAVIAAHLVANTTGNPPVSAEEPLKTITTGGHHILVGAGLVNTRNGEREGQAPRVRDLGEPAPTITAQGSQGAVCAAECVAPWMVKHYGGVYGHGVDQPIGTVTAVDHHSIGAAFIEKLHGSARAGQSVEDPAPTIAAGGGRGGGHAALVEAELERGPVIHLSPTARERARRTVAFLTAYYSGGGTSHAADEPAPTITTKDRLGVVAVTIVSADGVTTEDLVTVAIDGELWIVVDIAMRMLTPRELARAQGFADSYWLPPVKADAIARIGNSVVPQCAEALVRANLGTEFDDSAMAAK